MKYSKENIEDLVEPALEVRPLLIVQTMGGRGMRFKLRRANNTRSEWKAIDAYGVKHLKDAAGAGDWCTAGIIHSLGRGGALQLENMAEDELIEALRFGQALAALNCCFEGARGGMYILSKTELENEIDKIMSRKWAECPIASKDIMRDIRDEGEALHRDICNLYGEDRIGSRF